MKTAAAALATVLAMPAIADTVVLRRFERINPYKDLAVNWGDKSYKFMDVADTTLDSRHPNDNFGAARTLSLKSGQQNVVLLRFDQLNRAIWRGSKIVDVRLELHPVAGRFGPDVRIAAHRMVTDWRDGGADGDPMYWTATYTAAMSSPQRNAVLWQQPGARGNGDRRGAPSLTQNTSAHYNAATNTWTLTGAGLVADVQEWFARQHRNFGWALEMVDSRNAKGDVQFHSSDAMDKALRPTLIITYEPMLGEGAKTGPDLNVTFIERTPRYLRYHDNGRTSYERKRYRDDNPGIMKFPDNGDTQKWPKKGDPMTYTAHIKNSGFAPYVGPVEWVWRLNGKTLRVGATEVRLAPEESVTEKIQLPWSGDLSDIRDERLTFEIDPNDRIAEVTKNNNAQSKYMKARSWKYWVERSAYDYAKQFMTAYGSYSWEDYLKWHEQMWNETFLDKSRFDGVAPDGSTQRISFDAFEIVADGRLGGGIHRLDDKPDFEFDGEWGSEWLKGAALRDPKQVENIQNFVRATRILLEGSLLHEAAHQVLGAFDVYWSNQEPSEPHTPNGKVKVKDDGETYITRGYMYAYSGLMGGDDTRPNEHYTEGADLFSLHDIMGFTLNTPYRNGFYGEWQYDMPKNNFVRMLAADGSPLPNASVKIWQCSRNQIVDKNLVAENLRTDKDGVLRLPDQDSLEAGDVTTATGHTMRKKNPFGRVEVVGTNSVLLFRVEAFGQRDYRFMRVLDLNRAYWRGFKERYVHPVQTQITPVQMDWGTNIAKGRPVETARMADAEKLTDGDLKTGWSGGRSPAGSFIQIDMGSDKSIGAVRLIQNGSHGHFYQRFRIEASDDPGFRFGVRELNRQFPTSFALAMTNDRDILPADNTVRWVTYGARPTIARYLRITSLEETDGVYLSEIQVFPTR